MDYLEYLESMSPESGRMINESGEIVNIADISKQATTKGLVVMQHDDAMLSQNKSKFIELYKVPMSAGDWIYIELTVPAGVNHHVENRYVEVFGGQAEFCVVPNYAGSVPPSPTRGLIWNQNGPQLIPEANQLSYFNIWGPQTALPIDFDPFDISNRDKAVDYKTLYAEAAGFLQASTDDAFASAKGRHYQSNRHGALIHAIEDCTLTYKFNWHDFI